MQRRAFLKALATVPFAPTLLRGMDWAALEPAAAAARGSGGFSAAVPAGTILPFSGTPAPPGFLPCDGRAVAQVAFPKLYEAIGAAYGDVPPTRLRWWRRFRVPDLRASARPAAALAVDERDRAAGYFRPYDGINWVIRT